MKYSLSIQDLNGRENTSFLINIDKCSLLQLYRLLQVKRGPSCEGIAETGSLQAEAAGGNGR